MPYSENYYFSEAAKLECTGYVKPQALQQFKHKCQEVRFTYTAERNKVSDYLKELHNVAEECIYSDEQQFPKQTWIPLECEELQAAITQVVQNAAYRPPDISDTNKDLTTTNGSHTSDKEGSSKKPDKGGSSTADDKNKNNVTITAINENAKFEKSRLGFFQGIENLTKAIKVCSLNRYTFEAKYNLTWTTTPTNPPR